MTKKTLKKIAMWTGVALVCVGGVYVGYKYRHQIGGALGNFKTKLNDLVSDKARACKGDPSGNISGAAENIAHNVQTQSRGTGRNSTFPNIKVHLSDEGSVDKHIVNSLCTAARRITREVKKLTGVTLDIDVVSNMTSHPDAGELYVNIDKVPYHLKDVVQHICEKHMNMNATEVADGLLSFYGS